MLCITLSLLLTWRFFLPVLFQLFLNLILFPGFAVTRWWDKGEELQSFRSLPWDFFLVTKPWLKRLPFFFFLSQGFQSTTKSSLNEWNYLTTLGNERADWEAVIWMKFLQSILLVVFKPRVDTQIPISPGRNTCKTAPRTQCSFKPWIIKLFLYLVYLFQGLNNLEAHNYSSLFQLMFRKRIKCFVQKSHRHFAAVLELNWALPASNLVPTGWNLADSIAPTFRLLSSVLIYSLTIGGKPKYMSKPNQKYGLTLNQRS